MACCEPQKGKTHFVIIGGGSAAFAAAIKASELGAFVTLINDGLPIGGTCVNVGCVPSKTLIRAAEAHHRSNNPNFLGISSRSDVTDFRKVIQQKREMVEELRQAKYVDVVSDLPNFRIIEGRARFVAPKTVEVNGEIIEAAKILIATGARQFVPVIPGLEETDYLTNESLFELEELPESIIVLGGRYIALECAQMLARFGSQVTVLQRSSRILPTEMPDLTDDLTSYLSDEGMEIVTGVDIQRVGDVDGTVIVEAKVEGNLRSFQASRILIATGREPNTSDLGLEENGVELNDKGFVKVDERLRTTAQDVYAAGDVIGENMFVYTAAFEGNLAAENALAEGENERDYTALPWVIFTDPQVAGVGLDEKQAAQKGFDAEVSTLPLTYVPRAIAARDTRGVIKLIRNRENDRLLGARILAPEGSELLMEVSLAIKYGITINELISAFHPYLTLGEGIKLAAIAFGKDLEKLSCCAT